MAKEFYVEASLGCVNGEDTVAINVSSIGQDADYFSGPSFSLPFDYATELALGVLQVLLESSDRNALAMEGVVATHKELSCWMECIEEERSSTD